jgi:hypothetical protein
MPRRCQLSHILGRIWRKAFYLWAFVFFLRNQSIHVTGDFSFSESSLVAFSLEVWVFLRVLRLLQPKLALLNVNVFYLLKLMHATFMGKQSFSLNELSEIT